MTFGDHILAFAIGTIIGFVVIVGLFALLRIFFDE